MKKILIKNIRVSLLLLLCDVFSLILVINRVAQEQC